MKDILTFLLCTFLMAISSYAQPAISFEELYILSEENSDLEGAANQMAIAQGLPLSMYKPGDRLIEAKYVENGQIVYMIFTDLLDPAKGGAVAFYNQFKNGIDSDHFRINYGNGNIVNPQMGFEHAAIFNSLPVPDKVLIIPESTNDRVMAFDPFDGTLLNPNFIPTDPDNLSTPIAAISRAGNTGTFLVSDQVDDLVQEYAGNGSYVGSFAPMGGSNTSILENIRGIDFRQNSSNLLVTVGGGGNDDAIAEFDVNGAYLGNFIANGAGGLNSPFDVLFNQALGVYLVGGITSDKIHRYAVNGNPLTDFASINTFPEQLYEFADGRIGVANFSGTQEGVLIYSSIGLVEKQLNPPSLGGNRGVFLLGNGNILTTNGGGVYEIDMNGNYVESEVQGVSARFIHESQPPKPIPTLSQWGLIAIGLLLAILGTAAIRQNVSFQPIGLRNGNRK